jgi:protein SCO1/2
MLRKFRHRRLKTRGHRDAVVVNDVVKHAAAAVLVAWLVLGASPSWGAQQYSVSGLVLRVDRAKQTMVVSCNAIPGYMDAMVMPFEVPDGKSLEGVEPGMAVEFRLVVGQESSHAEDVRVRKFETAEQDPFTAHHLKTLQTLVSPSSAITEVLRVGQSVPDFKLIDQNRQPVTLGQFAGKVVAINFIYTRCALPQFCYRLSNNFALLQKRFADRMGRDLVLLTVSFDPEHDQPEILAAAAKTWHADSRTWHFLTGPVSDVKQVCARFGVDAWTDEGLMTHSLHTVVVNRQGKLAADLEGNQFTGQQLGDLVDTVIKSRN